jgi:hypothetical protein
MKLVAGHGAYRSIRMFVKAIQGYMLTGNEVSLHKTPDNDPEGAIRFGLRNNCNGSWTRIHD